MEQGVRVYPRYLTAAETAHWRARVDACRALFHRVKAKLGMNLSYHVMDGHQVEQALPDLFALIQGRLADTLQEAVGRELVPMRDRRRAIRIQWYQTPVEGLRWHIDGGRYSILLTLENSNGGATEVLPLRWSRLLRPVPYVLFPFPGILERVPSRALVSHPGDLIAIHGGAVIHRGTNPPGPGQRMLLVASFDPPDRRPTPVWDWLARRLNY